MSRTHLPGLHIGRGTSAGGLTLFPVWTDAPSLRGITTGARAQVRVSELDTGPSVGHLVLRNEDERPALLVEGELLEGGWQHRALNASILLAPGQELPVEVSCVEAGRWRGTGGHERRARRAPVNVAAGLRGHGARRQSDVWARVARFDAVRSPSPTASLLDHIDQPPPRPRLDLRPLDGQRGVLVGLGGVPASLELFPSPRALAAHWEGLVAAAELAGELSAQRSTPGSAARDFAVEVGRLALHDHERAGMGRSVRGGGDGVTVHGVRLPSADGGRLVHASAMLDTHPLVGAAGRAHAAEDRPRVDRPRARRR